VGEALPTRVAGAVGHFGLFVWSFFRAIYRHGVPWRLVLQEAFRIGVMSLPILLTIAFFVGTNLAVQGYASFAPLGGGRLVGMFVALAGVRELGPIITAAMVAAKAGTEMASQIGVMRIREQIDALEVMAVNPLSYLIAPRLIGIVIVLPALTTIAIFVMISTAFATSVWQLDVKPAAFLEFALQAMKPMDLVYGEIKGVVFGVIICTVSCWYGFFCKSGPEGVGEATNKAVVTSAVLCISLNYFLSELMYGG
jgi:phospholipid/cholesterol/gamma-HCH transport system permease protein